MLEYDNFKSSLMGFTLKSTLFTGIFFLLFIVQSHTQDDINGDALQIKQIFDIALKESKGYEWLYDLTNEVGGRLAGSPEGAAAVEYGKQIMETLNFDSIYLQACYAPHWERGDKELVRVAQSAIGSFELNALALGNSVGTGPDGLVGEVIEVKSLDELRNLSDEQVKDKIVFFNRPFDDTQINTFNAYGGAVDQRVRGPLLASQKGAKAAIVRSMTNKIDDNPHTGTTGRDESIEPIPGVAISTIAAEELSRALKLGSASVYIRTTCIMHEEPVLTYNVIGEIKGKTHPEEIILVGGHLDSWDVGGGAHDDGTGCVHSLQVIELLEKIDYEPNRTLRCVLFMNEENGLAGGKAYWEASFAANEYHMAAIESDRGGFTPRGFTVDGHKDIFSKKYKQVYDWLPLLEPYGLNFEKGGSGADIGGLKDQKGLLFGFLPDSQRYFDYHHTSVDHIEAVNKRELEMGAASMAALVWLLDKYGLN
jgi:carboxypeptidase Q